MFFCIVQGSVSAHMFLLQALGYGTRYNVSVKMNKHPTLLIQKRNKK